MDNGAGGPRRGRILFISAYDIARPSTGTARRGQELLAGLAPRHEIHLVYLDGMKSPGQHRVRPRLPDALASVDAVPYTKVGYFLFSQRMHQLACAVIEQHNCELVVADFENAGMYGVLLARRYRLPLLYNSHDIEYRRYLSLARRDWRRAVLMPYIYAVERLTAARSDRVIAISPDDASVFQRWTVPSRVAVVPGSFDAEQYHPFYPPPPPDAPPTVLFVGNMNYPPNEEAARLLQEKVIPAVHSRRPEVRFQFVGTYPAGLNLKLPGTEFTGYVEDLVPPLRAAHVVAAPLLRGGGMRIKTLEALACGKPIVATPLGLQGINRQHHSAVVVTEADGLADALLTVLASEKPVNPEHFAELKATYGTEAVVDQFDQVLRALLPREQAA
ncbi:MAG TPA: glycosyltransferase family 4 protein [Gemmatimonadales bacterium]|nr:glycosyltransferase family 4 protein [Gemmatimonadales bacterium]